MSKLIGYRFGQLTITAIDLSLPPFRHFLCTCTCGNTVTTTLNRLHEQRVLSCGCLKKRLIDHYASKGQRPPNSEGRMLNRLHLGEVLA